MWLNPFALAAPGLFAETYPELRFVGWTLVLALVIVAGVTAIVWTRRWHQEQVRQAPTRPTADDFRQLLDEGDLRPEEFERIRARLESPVIHPEMRPTLATEKPPERPGDPPPASPPPSDPTS